MPHSECPFDNDEEMEHREPCLWCRVLNMEDTLEDFRNINFDELLGVRQRLLKVEVAQINILNWLEELQSKS